MSKVKVPSEIKVDLPSSSPETPPRSVEEIQQEFTGVCARAGHLQYQIVVHQKDLELINEKLRALNLEAAASQVKGGSNA